uniref:(northern house mosquito) hypothetical protein n=1 Tax=Culex pipiens TaxID=7175 RepID=A0A8D8AZZ1_CULPI
MMIVFPFALLLPVPRCVSSSKCSMLGGKITTPLPPPYLMKSSFYVAGVFPLEPLSVCSLVCLTFVVLCFSLMAMMMFREEYPFRCPRVHVWQLMVILYIFVSIL